VETAVFRLENRGKGEIVGARTMLIGLYIIFIFYMTVLDTVMPKVFGEISLGWSVFFLFMIMFLIDGIRKHELRVSSVWIVLLFVFSVVSIASVSWTPFYAYDGPILLRFFARSFVPLFMAISAINLFREEKNVTLFMKHLSIAVFFLALIAIGQVSLGLFGGTQVVTGEARASATFQNPNGLAAFLAISLPFLLYAIEHKIVTKKRALVVVPTLVAGVLATASRKGVVAMALGFTIYLLFKRKIKYFFLLMAAYLVLGLGVVGYNVVSRRFESEEIGHQMVSRWGAVKLGLEMFSDNPLIGLGYDGYASYFPKYSGRSLDRSHDAHNLFVAVLANYGLVGFFLLMGILIYPLHASRRILKSRQFGQDEKDKAIACVAVMVSFCEIAWFAGSIVNDWPLFNLLYASVGLVLATYAGRRASRRSGR
jgi:hypothetical protein